MCWMTCVPALLKMPILLFSSYDESIFHSPGADVFTIPAPKASEFAICLEMVTYCCWLAGRHHAESFFFFLTSKEVRCPEVHIYSIPRFYSFISLRLPSLLHRGVLGNGLSRPTSSAKPA